MMKIVMYSICHLIMHTGSYSSCGLVFDYIIPPKNTDFCHNGLPNCEFNPPRR